MAKPVKNVATVVLGDTLLRVYCDKSKRHAPTVMDVESVIGVRVDKDSLMVWTNPRYDRNEVMEEIETLVTTGQD